MHIQSLGYRTDLIFPRFDGEIIDRGDYTVIRTPSNPSFYWGNFLLFPAPPSMSDFNTWRSLFAKEIGMPPDVNHIAIGWDTITGESGEIQQFLNVGFDLGEEIVLTTEAVQRSKYNNEIAIRRLREDWEWAAALECQITCRGIGYSREGYAPFMARQMQKYRVMAESGLGAWFGAFLGTKLVGDLGVYVEDDIARFQMVETHPEFRRTAVCSTLVYDAAVYAFEQLKAKTLVMVADENYHAAKIYESVGFKPTEYQRKLTWWQRDA